MREIAKMFYEIYVDKYEDKQIDLKISRLVEAFYEGLEDKSKVTFTELESEVLSAVEKMKVDIFEFILNLLQED